MTASEFETTDGSRIGTSERTGQVFEIQRFSIHDGPGIRTTVFLKGCPLRCLWCHNPESIDPRPLLSFVADKCINCGSCAEVCPKQAHVMDESLGHVFLRKKCDTLGACAEVCPSKALEIVGRNMTHNEVLEQVLRDRPFYEASGGGVTISGGEPLLQIDFAEVLLRNVKAAGVSTAVETAGHVMFERLARVAPYTDLFLFDIKETDDVLHQKFTGVSGAQIRKNLVMLHDIGASILMRLPIIPGLNDRKAHFREVARFTEPLTGLVGVEVMPYHSLGLSKRERLGLNQDDGTESAPPSAELILEWIRLLRDEGVNVVNEAH